MAEDGGLQLEGSNDEFGDNFLEVAGHINFNDDSMLRLKQEELDTVKANFDEYIKNAEEVEAELETALQIAEGNLPSNDYVTDIS